MVNPETLIEEEQKLVTGEEMPEIFEHVHTFDGETAFVFGGVGQPYVYKYEIEENSWGKLENLSKNIALIMNQRILTSNEEIK